MPTLPICVRYLISTGFENIVSDKDFPLSERLSKWGAHDHVLFDRVLRDLKETPTPEPYFKVIQTSSRSRTVRGALRAVEESGCQLLCLCRQLSGRLYRAIQTAPRVEEHGGGTRSRSHGGLSREQSIPTARNDTRFPCCSLAVQ